MEYQQSHDHNVGSNDTKYLRKMGVPAALRLFSKSDRLTCRRVDEMGQGHWTP